MSGYSNKYLINSGIYWYNSSLLVGMVSHIMRLAVTAFIIMWFGLHYSRLLNEFGICNSSTMFFALVYKNIRLNAINAAGHVIWTFTIFPSFIELI